eukprot:3935015-Rhodomonas_salina.1
MEPRRRPPFVMAVQDHQHRLELEGCGRVVARSESGGEEERWWWRLMTSKVDQSSRSGRGVRKHLYAWVEG